jgi:hypothetical protein
MKPTAKNLAETRPKRPIGITLLDRSPPSLVTMILACLIAAAPALLYWDELATYRLSGDDFVYLARSRTLADLLKNLLVPHNAHVVPLFRIVFFLLVQASGGFEHLATTCAICSFALVAAVSLATGRFVARETRSLRLGLAACAAISFSTNLEAAVVWFAAGQALWAGLIIILMLLCLQKWTLGGSNLFLAIAAIFACCSPLFWSGGYISAPVGFAYLFFQNDRTRSLRAAVLTLAAPILVAGIIALVLSNRAEAIEPRGFSGIQSIRIERGITHTCQGFIEFLIVGNLGLEVETTAAQSIIFTFILILIWLRMKSWRFRPTPLEAAGATTAILGLWLPYTFRSTEPFALLRGLGWYLAIPQIGAAFFAIGAFDAARRRNHAEKTDLTVKSCLLIIALMLAATAIEKPRADRYFLADVPPLTDFERARFETDDLGLVRARAIAELRAGRQSAFLKRLHQIEITARKHQLSRRGVRSAIELPPPPGMPRDLKGIDSASLLALPDTGQNDSEAAKTLSGIKLERVPPFRPDWIPPNETWPRVPRFVGRSDSIDF